VPSEPESTSSAVESTLSAPDSTADAPIVRPISTAPVTEAGSTDATAVLVLPQGAFSSDAVGTEPSDPDRQDGVIMMAADEFAAALVAANPDWSGEPPEPNPDGTLDFEMSGFGRTASVHVNPAAPTSGAVIVGFSIEYA
jgi:hypothetical protein